MATELLSFQQAIAQATGKKRLLIGNGFSQSCRLEIFSYGSLFEKADFSSLSGNAKKAFDALKTTNFEEVIKALRDSSKLTKIYAESNKSLADQMKSDSEGLKKILVDTIAKNHPLQPNEISNDEFTKCRSFIKNFDTIYTLNYDLLLYWTLLHVTGFEEKKRLNQM